MKNLQHPCENPLTCLLVNDFLSVSIKCDDNFRVTPVVFFTADYSLSSWESSNLTFTMSYSVILF